MFSRSALISVTVAVLGVLAGAAAAAERDPNLEIIIQVRDGAVGLPSPHAAVAPQLASLRSDLRDVLAHPNVLQIERVSPDAKRSESYHVTRDGRAVRTIDMSNVYRIRVATSAMRERLIEQLRVTEDVVFADPNQSIELRSLPNDPDLKLQWAVKNTGQASGRPGADIGVEQAWAYSTGSPLVRIGVVDLGVDPLHPEFGGRVTGTTGSDIHATGVASIAAAAGSNAQGMAGIVWNNPIISEVITLSDAATVHDAIVNAVDLGCQVIDVSWGMTNYYTLLGDAIAYAYMNHVLVVCAMPEPHRDGEWPNKFQEMGVLNVGALGNDGNAATYSNQAPYVDLMAPGGNRIAGLEAADIYHAIPVQSGSYAFGNGTSYAAPHVAGAAALLIGRAYQQGWAPGDIYGTDVRAYLRISGADDIGASGFDQATGYGRLNARRLLKEFTNAYFQRYEAVGGTDLGGPPSPYTCVIHNVPGLAPGTYAVRRHEVQKTVNMGQAHVWGLETTQGWPIADQVLPASQRALYNTGWCEPAAYGPTTVTLRTYVYEVYTTLLEWIGWYPCQPSQVVFRWGGYSPVVAAPTLTAPNASQSFFVPEADAVANPTVGTNALKYFYTCPNVDVSNHSARLHIVVRDSLGAGIAGIDPAEIFALLNGGTAAQGFSGAGSDSVIANSQYNPLAACPDLRTISADAATDASGNAYITLIGSAPGSPGVGLRDPQRKWGHYDSEIPVYVRGVKLQGRLTSGSANGSYKLSMKNADLVAGLTTLANQGEVVNSLDYNDVASHAIYNEPDSADPLNWWRDFDNSGFVNSIDLNFVNAHANHKCDVPNNP